VAQVLLQDQLAELAGIFPIGAVAGPRYPEAAMKSVDA